MERLAERLETTEKANDVQRQMLEAAARRRVRKQGLWLRGWQVCKDNLRQRRIGPDHLRHITVRMFREDPIEEVADLA